MLEWIGVVCMNTLRVAICLNTYSQDRTVFVVLVHVVMIWMEMMEVVCACNLLCRRVSVKWVPVPGPF